MQLLIRLKKKTDQPNVMCRPYLNPKSNKIIIKKFYETIEEMDADWIFKYNHGFIVMLLKRFLPFRDTC